MTRYAKRRDANEQELFTAARAIGIKVFTTNELGDAVFQIGSEPNYVQCLVEVKTEVGKLTEAQCRRKQQGLIARVVRTVDDVLAAKKWMLERLK